MAETTNTAAEDGATVMVSAIDHRSPPERALRASARAREEAAMAPALRISTQNTSAVAKHLREISAATANPLPRSVPAP